MNDVIDLMPPTCREWLGRRLRVKRWTMCFLATFAVLSGAYLIFQSGQAARQMEVDRLAGELKQRWTRDEEIQRLLRDIKAVETTVTRYNRLAWPVRVTEAIDAIGVSMPASASLTTLQISPREETASAAKKRPADAESAPGPRTFMVLEMEGVARGDQDVANLVAGLEGRRLFSRVSLDYTRAVTVDGVEAREYRLTCEIDLSLRYAVATDGREYSDATQ